MIREIELSKLENHPQNVRKTYTDIEELADSIKAKGILQNLTVVLQPGETDKYFVVIGNRRLKAAKLAGIKTAPCFVADMDEREQTSVMLLENIQRNDLTLYEQAQGFQMMLDFGETESSIAQKTGFSKTTVRHRLNIAKLDQDALKKREEDDSFQLSLQVLYELEKVKDVRERNRILRSSSNSRDLVNRAQNAVAEASRKEKAESIAKMLEKISVKPAPETYEEDRYSGKWDIIATFSLDDNVPKTITLPKDKAKSGEQLYYANSYNRWIYVVKKKSAKKKLTPAETEQARKNANKKQLKTILKISSVRRSEFVKNIIDGKVDPVKDEAAEIRLIWDALTTLGVYVSAMPLRKFFSEKEWYNCTDAEKEEISTAIDKIGLVNQMLIILDHAMSGINEISDWNLHFIAEKGNALLKGYEALKPYGWFFENEDETSVLDGTNSLFEPQKETP